VIHPVDKARKPDLLIQLIKSQGWYQVLVFSRTKHGANKLAKKLDSAGINSAAIHGNKSQAARERALSEFKKNKVQVLVATDIAARGLDISQLPHVVNFDLPNVAEDYVHRIGRTGRAGKSGHAISFACEKYALNLPAIETYVDHAIPVTDYDSSALLDDIKAPKFQHRRRPDRGRGNKSGAPRGGNRKPGSRGRR
jgi:ATP-dependent RNA helicase RhlE